MIHPETESIGTLTRKTNRQMEENNRYQEIDEEVADHQDTPLRFIKQMLQEIASSPEIRANLTTLGIGFAATYISKMWFKRYSGQVLQRTLTIALIIAMSQVIKKGLSALLSDHDKD